MLYFITFFGGFTFAFVMVLGGHFVLVGVGHARFFDILNYANGAIKEFHLSDIPPINI